MPETVFWDTAAFVALGNRDDELHPMAIAVSQKLAQESALILTTDAVLLEVANTFSRAELRPLARQVIEAFQTSARMRAAHLIHVDSELWQRGWQFFVDRPDKDWSLTDCFSFLVMHDAKCGGLSPLTITSSRQDTRRSCERPAPHAPRCCAF